MPQLRILSTPPASAAFNMAADLFFMQQCVHSTTIILRTYTWKPAAITIGYMQNAATQLNLTKLAKYGIDWIRRPTGGRAVLHKGDLTYSCIFPRTITYLGTTVDATATIIMQCLFSALVSLGITPEIQNSSDQLIKSGRHVKLPCFLAPNRNEIMMGGKKLIGSAQYRSKHAVLQHGSIPITSESTQLPRFLQLDDDEAALQHELLKQKSSCISNILPATTTVMLADALKSGFRNTLASSLEEHPLSPFEYAEITRLMCSDQFKATWCSPELPADKNQFDL